MLSSVALPWSPPCGWSSLTPHCVLFQIIKILNSYTPIDDFEKRVTLSFVRKVQVRPELSLTVRAWVEPWIRIRAIIPPPKSICKSANETHLVHRQLKWAISRIYFHLNGKDREAQTRMGTVGGPVPAHLERRDLGRAS